MKMYLAAAFAAMVLAAQAAPAVAQSYNPQNPQQSAPFADGNQYARTCCERGLNHIHDIARMQSGYTEDLWQGFVTFFRNLRSDLSRRNVLISYGPDFERYESSAAQKAAVNRGIVEHLRGGHDVRQ